MSIAVKVEIERHLQSMLNARLAKLSEKQRALFDRLYPLGPRADQVVNAIDLCDRTIRKNEADPSRLSASADEGRKP